MKSRLRLAIEEEVARLRTQAAARRDVSAPDPVADGIDYAAAQLEQRLVAVDQPALELSVVDWGLEQEPPVSERTVRRWIEAGEVETVERSSGLKILAGTRRIPRDESATDGADAREAAEATDAPMLARAG